MEFTHGQCQWMIAHCSAVFNSLAVSVLCHVQSKAGFVSSDKNSVKQGLSFAGSAHLVHLSQHRDWEVLYVRLSD